MHQIQCASQKVETTMKFEEKVEATLVAAKQFLMCGATGSVTISVNPKANSVSQHVNFMVGKDGETHYCIVPSVSFIKER